MVRPRVFRPFPAPELRDALADAESVAVLTKEMSPGYESAFAGEIKGALYHAESQPPIKSYVLGMAGRDVKPEDIAEIVEDVKTATPTMTFRESESWPQLQPDLLEGGEDR